MSIFKDPVDDKGKKSKKGKLKLRYKNGVFQTIEESQKDTDNEDDKDDKDVSFICFHIADFFVCSLIVFII